MDWNINNELRRITSLNKVNMILNLKYLHLNLSNRNLKELPAEIGQLTNLKHLYLHNNELKELPTLSSNVQVYGIDNQTKTSVTILGKEYDIETTTKLNLSFENLKELPAEIVSIN